MRVAVVINTASGGLIGREHLADEVAAGLAAAGLDARIIPHEAAEGLEARLDLAVAEGADAIVVGGGDGTITAAATRLLDTDIALGIIPLGTMNMLARDLGLPLEPGAAVAALATGEVRAIDAAEVNGHVFLCSSVIGLPSRLGRHRERHRGKATLRTRWLFFLAALRGTWRNRPMRLDVEMDGRRQVIFTRAVAVANNAYAEGFGLMMRRARLDAGVLVLYVAKRFGILWSVWMLLAMSFGAWRSGRMLAERSAPEVTLQTRRRRALRVMNDGEHRLLHSPLVYRIRPKALRVIVPRASPTP